MDNPFRFTMENLPTDYDHRAAQVEAISDALQELMHEGPVKAHEGILEAIQWLNSPELKELREAWNEAERQQNAEDDAWWDSLDYNGKSQAFRQIVKLMHKAEVLDKGSYRYAMDDIFNLDYGDGLSHYMMLHNLIHQGLEAEAGSYKQIDKDARNDDTCA